MPEIGVGVWRPNPYKSAGGSPSQGLPQVSCETIKGLYLTRCRGLATNFLGLETKPLLFVPPGRAIPGFAWAVCFYSPNKPLVLTIVSVFLAICQYFFHKSLG
jgi:hypothetical protein